jgi:hypothetical protein
MNDVPDYRTFSYAQPKARRRRTKAAKAGNNLATNHALRLSLTLEAHELGMNLTDYLEVIGYERHEYTQRMVEQGDCTPEEPVLHDEESGEDDWEDPGVGLVPRLDEEF